MKKLILLAISLLLVSCATIMSGTTQLVTINCNVVGAHVYIDGVEVGVTPFMGEIKKNQKVLTIEMEGYQTYSGAMSKSLESIFWGNIITGGTIGSITDFSSGAAYTYAPSSYQIELYKTDTGLEDFKKVFELKKFAMVNMSHVANDLAYNDGPYLNSIIQLAGLEINDTGKHIVKDNLYKSGGDQVVFGQLMASTIDM